ncbi:hypothetical protein [Arthrobacter pigmenti]
MSNAVRLSIAIAAGLMLGAGLGYLFSLNNPGSAAVSVTVFALMTAPALAAAVWLIMNRRQHSRETRKNEQNVERAWSDRASGWAFAFLVCALVLGSLSSNIFNVGGIDPVVYVAFGMAAYGICYLVIKRRES